MTLYNNKYRVETARLRGYDYAQSGAYYITICTKGREKIMGNVINGDIVINDFGKTCWECWHDLPSHYHNLLLDAFVVMPDHVHGIMIITDENNAHASVDVGESVTGGSGINDGQTTYDRAMYDGYPISVETGLKPVSTADHHDRADDHDRSGHHDRSDIHVHGDIHDTSMAKTHGMSEFVRAFKTFSARRINVLRKTPGVPVWQQRFYDRIIRNENDLNRARKYIYENPIKWQDRMNRDQIFYA